MRGKKPKERQRYVLRVNETLIEVTRDVYLAWYQSRRKERVTTVICIYYHQKK